MQKIIRTLTDTLTWAASSDISPIDLPREGLITEVRLRLHMTGSATLAAANQPDHLRRLAESLKIEGEGGRTFLGLSGEQTSRILGLLNNLDYNAPLMTLMDSATEDIVLVFHPGSNPRDPFDLSAAIPAQDMSQLQLKWSTTAATALDDTVTISSGVGYVTIFEVLDVPTPKGLMVPLSSTFSWVNDAAYSDYSKEIDIPCGNFLRRMAILAQDETALRPVRKDDQITALRVRLPKTGRSILELSWEDLKQLTATWYKAGSVVAGQIADVQTAYPAAPDGFGVLDFRMLADPVYGLDLRGYQVGDIKLGLTVATPTAGDDTIIWYDQLAPWDR